MIVKELNLLHFSITDPFVGVTVLISEAIKLSIYLS